jgi:hypothetical protein
MWTDGQTDKMKLTDAFLGSVAYAPKKLAVNMENISYV